MSKKSNPIALLIDGDNVSPALVPQLLDVVSEHGNPIIRQVFFNKVSLEQWDIAINKHSLIASYVPNNTSRKNAADIALVIRAMELLYEREDLTGFCIVSSDSDFTGLAKYIVAKAKLVLGIGADRTPESFRNACSQFVRFEDLSEKESPPEKPTEPTSTAGKDESVSPQAFEQSFIQAFELCPKDADGWAQLLDIKERMGNLGSELQNTRHFAEKVKSVAEAYPGGLVEVFELIDHKPVIHYIRIADCDIFKIIEAYISAPRRERDGWVFLNIIGGELRKYPSYEDGYTYRGVRSKRLSKVVAEMLKDYGELIEMYEEHDENSVTHLVRVNF